MSRPARVALASLLASTILCATPALAGSPYDGWRGQSASPSYAGAGRRSLDGSYRGVPPIWGGLYMGAHLGGGWGRTTPYGISESAIGSDGVVGGLHAGYNLQFNRVVTGFEVDLSWTNDSASASYPGRISAASELDWLSSARIRLGYTFDNLLVYATGGIAIADLNIRTTALGVTSNTSEIMTGYVLGGGLEAKITRNVSGRLEALHYRFSDERFGTSAGVLSVDKDVTTVRAGLSLHLN